MGSMGKINYAYHIATCGHERTILKKNRGNKTRLLRTNKDSRGGNPMATEAKAALERGIEGAI